MKLKLSSSFVQNHFPILLILLASIAFITPAFIRGSGGSDLLFHMIWHKHFSAQLWQGNIYPRWLPDLNAGAGSPVFLFYPPIAYYTASLFYFVEALFNNTWLSLACTGFLVIFLAGIFSYIWLYSLHPDRMGALCGAISYIVAPFTCLTFYVRFSFSEFFVVMWAPLLLYLTRNIALGNKSAVIAYALAFAGLLMSSIPGTIVFGAAPLVYYAYNAGLSPWRKTLPLMVMAHVLGAGVAAVYLLPMVMDQPFVRLHKNEIWQGIWHYAYNFVFFPTHFERGPLLLYNFFLIGTINICIAIIAFKLFKKIKGTHKNEALFWFSIIIFSLFAMSWLSKPLWELFSIVQIIQYPWRISIIPTLALIPLIALYMPLAKPESESMFSYYGWFFIGLISLYITCLSFSLSHADSLDSNNPITTDKDAITRAKFYAANTGFSYEYMPKWADVSQLIADHTNPDNIDEFIQRYKTQAKSVFGNADVTVTRWQAGDILINTRASSGSIIEVGQLYYPNWQVVDEHNTPLDIGPATYTGMIHITVPEGTHTLHLTFAQSLAEQWGKRISLVSLLLLALMSGKVWVVNRLRHLPR